MKHRFLLTLSAFVLAVSLWAQGQAKYVFYFIGDGMGVNQVNGTQTYLAALEGRIGITPLCFTRFPVCGLVTTFSGTNGVTDSAAAGTALATGRKTGNHVLGLLADEQTPVTSVAQWAHEAGAAVGVSTSVSVDHATPAAFYAHVADRNAYHQIGNQLPDAGFDFYAGSDFRKPAGAEGEADTYARCREAGYTVVRGYKAYAKAAKKAQRMVLLQPEKPSHGDRTCLPYAIDRQQGDLTLTDITRAGLSFLMSKQGEKQGFFLMVEGGKIDYACHANDAATVFHETIDMDEAVRVAYEFYMQHPDETLIVVTADHETGGIVLGRGPYELHLDVLKYQKLSAEAYTKHLRQLHTQLGDKLTWERMKQDLTEYWGFWKGVSLNQHQSERLENAYNAFINGKDKGASNMYANLGGIADAARRTLAEIALVGWQSGGHSNGYVPVFAIGVGAERFGGQIDNTQIPLRIAEIAGWQQTAK